MNNTILLEAKVPNSMGGKRLDQVMSLLFSEYSRGQIQKWIKADNVLVNDLLMNKPKITLIGGELIQVKAELKSEGDWIPQDIDFETLYDDKDIIIVNKHQDLVVHPGAGNEDGTLVNGLLYRFPSLINVPRAGIVHRLDKETSGLLVVAKNLIAHAHLVNQLQQRAFAREYLAVCQGHVPEIGTIRTDMGRHPVHRVKMAVVMNGKPAITHYQVEQYYRSHSLVRVKLETGRTHQIRVHMTHLGHPLVGDPMYGGRPSIPMSASNALVEAIKNFPRQALHARKLGLEHPTSGEWMEWETPVPEDMATLLSVLEDDMDE
ncbi:MAG: 23S rRNA pseudouridine(1911/1915/1917) synthase RluD [Gammaproteobacteria bacterium CG22_combo_CG10-13_8_21_14_all_40_8]|nr:MAG: 23S rRNA pseudouridine(1911/1915/1917) synthase RluD [Gammaproteobacteria bacterium CG22_combo_CG10-13_8_21_14_all_40_8]